VKSADRILLCERVKYEYTGDPLKKVSIYLKYIAKAGMTAAEVDHIIGDVKSMNYVLIH
jgi:hypothetical protein